MTPATAWVKPNVAAWAPMGGYGWRPCVVVTPPRRRGIVTVRFETGRKGRGTRFAHFLVPRDPTLRGKDKPSRNFEELLTLRAESPEVAEIFARNLAENGGGAS
jgi:hypothetical protein